MIRNGLAHTYIAKPGILVTKGDPESHMLISDKPQLIIDALQFVADFRKSYDDYWKPGIDPDKEGASARLQSMLEEYSKESEISFEEFFKQNSSSSHLPPTAGSPAYYSTSTYRTSHFGVSTSPVPMSCVQLSASPAMDLHIDIDKLINRKLKKSG